MRARLIIELGAGTPRVSDLDPEKITTLGRSRDNTVWLHDECVSRQHARIFFDQDHWVLCDEDTRNGTFVNGEPVSQQVGLEDNCLITIGDLRLRFHLGKPPDLYSSTNTFSVKKPALAEVPESKDGPRTPLWLDELSCLHQFTIRTRDESDPHDVISSALEIVAGQTKATVTAYLNLDPANLLAKVIWPTNGQVDQALSRRLTDLVRQTGATARLHDLPPPAAEEGSHSLALFSDALCVPLRVEEDIVGAMHLYKDKSLFVPREVRFCETVAVYTAGVLTPLRLRSRLETENRRQRGSTAAMADFVGTSPVMQQLRRLIARVGPTNSTVLIQGETGAGKEEVARALHRQSPRAKRLFVPINCGAIPEKLLESELFGHEKGAFTGAQTAHQGLFQQADEGILFLDEIAELPMPLQVKLLRAIDHKLIRPIKSPREIPVNVRIIAAANKDLGVEFQEGRFREDLLYRLQVVVIHVPPLREHAEDIPLLVDHFLAILPGGKMKTVSPQALKRLQEFHWPGNVRQLRGVLESALIMAEGDVIGPGDLCLPNLTPRKQRLGFKLADWEACAINNALDETNGHMTKAAELLGISRETLGLKMKLYKLGKYAQG